MAKLELSLALMANERSRPIINGSVRPEGIDLTITVGKSGGEIFWRQLHNREFDVAEMSFSDTLMMISRGDNAFVMLPVFMTRKFFHADILVRADAGIESPADLRGKRLGFNEYVQTAHVWSRGILHEEFGVHPDEIKWRQERPEAMSHCHYFGMKPPPKDFQYIPPEKTSGEMILAGEIDGVMHYHGQPSMMDRSSANLRSNPAVRPLFAKPRAEQARYFEKTGIYPMNHGPVIRRSILERHPWVAINLYQAFVAAKQQSLAGMREMADLQMSLGRMTPEARAALDFDPMPYGFKANRKMLETCARYSFEQGLSPRLVGMEEVFATSTLDF